MHTLGERLFQLRTDKDLSQKDIAGAVNIPIAAYKSYENNISQPTSGILIVLARFFNVSVDFLCGLSDDGSPAQDGGLRKITEIYLALDEGPRKFAGAVLLDLLELQNGQG